MLIKQTLIILALEGLGIGVEARVVVVVNGKHSYEYEENDHDHNRPNGRGVFRPGVPPCPAACFQHPNLALDLGPVCKAMTF